jgi:hypothetical protein
MVTIRRGGIISETNNSFRNISFCHPRMGRILVVLLLGAIGGWWWGWITSGLITGHLPTNSDNNNNNSNNNNNNQLSPFHSISNLPHESKVSLSSVLPVKMNDNNNNNNNNKKKKLRFTPIQQSSHLKNYPHERMIRMSINYGKIRNVNPYVSMSNPFRRHKYGIVCEKRTKLSWGVKNHELILPK